MHRAPRGRRARGHGSRGRGDRARCRGGRGQGRGETEAPSVAIASLTQSVSVLLARFPPAIPQGAPGVPPVAEVHSWFSRRLRVWVCRSI
ncbi:unnamed protein product [Microthlaspi erraticum]|uniref:Uncharacterized protein n=1 Tax=Microthlaspi erraticum TaxID=1685480 RepID=A0A6D2IMN4_9BRAS|nr:unnamed protein product [Microthlaspi erraticum]